MKLQNGYKVIYEKIADGERTFFADKMDGNGAKQLENTDGTPFTIGKYKLVFEKDGRIWGSETGKIEDGVCFDAFDEVLVEGYEEEAQEPAPANVEPKNEEPDVNDEGDDEGQSEIDPEDEE
jgi:hypothetical protein